MGKDRAIRQLKDPNVRDSVLGVYSDLGLLAKTNKVKDLRVIYLANFMMGEVTKAHEIGITDHLSHSARVIRKEVHPLLNSPCPPTK